MLVNKSLNKNLKVYLPGLVNLHSNENCIFLSMFLSFIKIWHFLEIYILLELSQFKILIFLFKSLLVILYTAII